MGVLPAAVNAAVITTTADPTEAAAAVIIEAAIGVPAAVNAAATGIPEAATEEVSAAEAADRVPPEGIPVTASTEETDHLFF